MSLRNFFKNLLDTYCREFRIVGKDPGIILFFVFLPFVYPIVYSLIYNPEVVRDVAVVVVDHDRTPASRELVRNIDATQGTWIIGYAADLPDARHAMDSHKAYGILEIPEGFGRKIGRSEVANAVIYSDMSLLLRYRSILVSATDVMMEMGAELQTKKIDEIAPLASTVSPGDLLPVHNVSMGDITGGFDSFVMPGVVVLILHQCIILAIAMAGGAKHEGRRYTGYVAYNDCPSTTVSMLGRSLCYLTVLMVPSIFIAHYVPLIFRFPMAGDNLEIFCFLLPMMIACMAIGYIMQGLIRQRESVFIVWVITSVAFLFLSGLTWPRFAMPPFWRFVSDLLPATWGVDGFIRMNSNGATLAQCSHAYIYLWIQAAVYMAIAWGVQKYVVRPLSRRVYLEQQSPL